MRPESWEPMRHLSTCSAIGLCLLLALGSTAPGQEPESTPPWGRQLGEVEPAGEAVRTGGPRFWLHVESLIWWTRNGSAPPLLTRGELDDPLPGALGQP